MGIYIYLKGENINLYHVRVFERENHDNSHKDYTLNIPHYTIKVNSNLQKITSYYDSILLFCTK